jgi:hypothetical protein
MHTGAHYPMHTLKLIPTLLLHQTPLPPYTQHSLSTLVPKIPLKPSYSFASLHSLKNLIILSHYFGSPPSSTLLTFHLATSLTQTPHYHYPTTSTFHQFLSQTVLTPFPHKIWPSSLLPEDPTSHMRDTLRGFSNFVTSTTYTLSVTTPSNNLSYFATTEIGVTAKLTPHTLPLCSSASYKKLISIPHHSRAWDCAASNVNTSLPMKQCGSPSNTYIKFSLVGAHCKFTTLFWQPSLSSHSSGPKNYSTYDGSMSIEKTSFYGCHTAKTTKKVKEHTLAYCHTLQTQSTFFTTQQWTLHPTKRSSPLTNPLLTPGLNPCVSGSSSLPILGTTSNTEELPGLHSKDGHYHAFRFMDVGRTPKVLLFTYMHRLNYSKFATSVAWRPTHCCAHTDTAASTTCKFFNKPKCKNNSSFLSLVIFTRRL